MFSPRTKEKRNRRDSCTRVGASALFAVSTLILSVPTYGQTQDATTSPKPPNIGAANIFYDTSADRVAMIGLINKLRKSRLLPLYIVDNDLQRTAQNISVDMSRAFDFAHVGFASTTDAYLKRISAAKFSSLTEDTIWFSTQLSPVDAFNKIVVVQSTMYVASPWSKIMSTKYKSIGVGSSRSSQGGTYFVFIYGVK